MADAVAILRAAGLGMPDLIVRAAGAAGLELGGAAALVRKESGGRNVYGHDAVPTGGTYTKGGPVTRENYAAYRRWQRAGSGRMQGVGPVQLTYYSFQDEADRDGGCWEPSANLRRGFRLLVSLMRQHGDQQGARRYNGSGAQAEKYGRDFIAQRAELRRRLQGATVPRAPAPARPAAGRRRLLVVTTPRMTGSDVRELQEVLRRWYRLPAAFVDGIYGPGTAAQVRRVQENTPGLIVDEKAGAQVYKALGMSA